VVLLVLMLGAALWTVMTSNLLKSAIGLALTSAILTLVLFVLCAPLAGVFELSVCAGLITVVFISTISLTRRLSHSEAQEARTIRARRFILLPVVLSIAAWWLASRVLSLGHPAPYPATEEDVRQVLWFSRRFDLVGQILIILAGIFGVVVLFKTKESAGGEDKK
jgi:NADH-quinone oxidoreductase subunit J